MQESDVHQKNQDISPQPPRDKVRNLVYTCPVDHLGTSVFVKGWLTPGAENDPLVLVHDLGETAESIAPFAKKMALSGYSVYCFDLRGHGQSGRRLGHVPSFNQLSLDLLQVVAWVRHKERGQKPLVIGHGMGALVSLHFARGYAKFCKGMVLASPIFHLSQNIRPIQRLALKTLSEFFPTMMTPQWLCPMFTQFQKVSSKSKPFPKISVLLAFELLTAISQSRKLLQRHRLPTLLLCPKDDPVCKYEFLKRVIQKHKYQKKLELVYLDSNQHQLLSSKKENLNTIVDAINSWVFQKLVKPEKTEINPPQVS